MADREKVIKCLTDIEQIMICRQEICPKEELQYWIELQEGIADALSLIKEQEHKDRMFHALEDDWKRLKKLLKEKEGTIKTLEDKNRKIMLLLNYQLEKEREQEADKKDAEYMPMEVVPMTIGNDYRTWLCSACGSKLQYRKELICPKCNRKIDWEGR